jgi:tetratricopeptide (TPR) repeat protein
MANSTDEQRRPAKGKRGTKRGGDVIHVQFGRTPNDRGRADARLGGPAHQTANAKTQPKSLSASAPREPVTDLFSLREVAKLLDVPATRLRSLDRAGIVTPSGSRSGRRAYTFQDLIALRATRELLAKSIKMHEVAKAIGALRTSLPSVTRPLQELRIVSDGKRVVVRTNDKTFEPISGQMVMDFQVTALRDDVVRVLRPETSERRAKMAYELYCRASALDEDPATFGEAEALYANAVEIDPTLSIAHTNLGNIKFRRGDDIGAEELYLRALAIDGRQPEAHYNLGYVMLERGAAHRAVIHFERALESDPRFSDAHFNLAMACEQLGDRNRARTHWMQYLELEPQGTWAEVARQHLG